MQNEISSKRATKRSVFDAVVEAAKSAGDYTLSKFDAAEVADGLIKKHGKNAVSMAKKPFLIDGKCSW